VVSVSQCKNAFSREKENLKKGEGSNNRKNTDPPIALTNPAELS